MCRVRVGGLDSKFGKERVTFLFVCIMGWQPQRRAGRGWVARGSSGVVPSHHHIHSCWGWAAWEDEGSGWNRKKKKRKEEIIKISHDVRSSSMLDLNVDDEVEPVEHS